MEDQPINEQESLRIIHAMINKTQGRVSDNGFYFLLWGWLVFTAAISSWMIIAFCASSLNWLPWAILMPSGGLVSMIYGWKVERHKSVKTYSDVLMDYLTIGFITGLFIVLFVFAPKLGWLHTYPIIMLVYGFWLYASGCVLQFRPLQAGGMFNFACSACSLWITSYHIILVLALAVLAGYIIPGHLLSLKYKRENK